MKIQKKQATFGANIATLAKSHQAPLLRYASSAPRGELVDRSLGRTNCRGQRDRLRRVIYVANLIWQHGWPKNKPLPLSPSATGIPAAWKNFINGVPITDKAGRIKIGELVIADLTQWKKTWKALERSAKIDAKNTILDKLELEQGIIPEIQINSLARHHNTNTTNLTSEFFKDKEYCLKQQEEIFKQRAESLDDTENLTYGDLEQALDELQIPQGKLKNRTDRIPFGPYNPKWYTDASLDAGGPIREE